MCEVRDILEVLLVHALDVACLGLALAFGGSLMIRAWVGGKAETDESA